MLEPCRISWDRPLPGLFHARPIPCWGCSLQVLFPDAVVPCLCCSLLVLLLPGADSFTNRASPVPSAPSVFCRMQRLLHRTHTWLQNDLPGLNVPMHVRPRTVRPTRFQQVPGLTIRMHAPMHALPNGTCMHSRDPAGHWPDMARCESGITVNSDKICFPRWPRGQQSERVRLTADGVQTLQFRCKIVGIQFYT